MRGKRLPPNEPVTARMRTILQGRLPTGRALHCGLCGQRLPTLTYLPIPSEYLREGQREDGDSARTTFTSTGARWQAGPSTVRRCDRLKITAKSGSGLVRKSASTLPKRRSPRG